MGGYLEFALYRMYPKLMRGLVLADTRAEADKAEQVQWRFNIAQRTSAEGPSAVIAEMLPKLLAPRRYEQDRDLVAQVRGMIAAAPVQGIIGALIAMAERPDSTGLLPAIEIPTLVVVGGDDVLTPPSDAERIAESISGSELVVIPDAGHLSNLEQPGRFSGAVEGFAKNVFQLGG
jgi:pimeloyl-ACP methyl ester carboxylesterase